MATKTYGGSDITYGSSQFLYGGGEVAVIWWKSFIDTIWSNDGNYATTEGAGASDANQTTATDSLYLSDTATPNNLSLDANEVALNFYTAVADTGGSDAWTGILDLVTFNLILSGEIKMVSGSTLDIGISSDIGLSCTSLSMAAGSIFVGAATSKILASLAIAIDAGATWPAGAGNIKLTGNDANVDFGGKSIGPLEVAGTAGQTKTNLSDFTCASYTGLTGTFDYNSKIVTVNGDIKVANVANLLADTGNAGKFVMAGNGDLEIRNATNALTHLEVSAGITANATNNIWVKKCISGAGTTISDGGGRIFVNAMSNDSWIQDAAAVVNCPLDIFISDNFSNAGIVKIANDFAFRPSVAAQTKTLTLSADVTCFKLKVDVGAVSHYGKIIFGANLQATSIEIGNGGDEGGQIDLGAGIHVVSGNIAQAAGCTSANNAIDWGSGRTSIGGGGNLDLTNIPSTPGTAVVEFTGTGDQELTLDSETIYNLEVDKASDSLLVKDDGIINSLIGTRGGLKSDSAGVQRELAASIQSVVANMTIQDISMGAANMVNAKPATNSSGGNNLGIVFEDSFGEM